MSADLTMIQGDTSTFALTLVDEAGDPLDLTDCALYVTVGDYFTKSIGDGVTVDADPTTGLASVTIEPTDTEDLAVSGRLRTDYAVRVVLADDSVKTPIRGRFAIIPVPVPVT
jgi:hypothetical protein